MEKPIFFNTVMVQAIVGLKKTQTRRIIKNKYENSNIEWFTNKYGTRLVYMQNDVPEPVYDSETKTTRHQLIACEEIKKPYDVGDILWVRETWKISSPWGDIARGTRTAQFIYKAGYSKGIRIPITNDDEKNLGMWRPSIHMPRKAARIFLKVTDVRAEKLNVIDSKSARAEGIVEDDDYEAVRKYAGLWNNIYHKQGNGWGTNTWVWAIEFEKVEV